MLSGYYVGWNVWLAGCDLTCVKLPSAVEPFDLCVLWIITLEVSPDDVTIDPTQDLLVMVVRRLRHILRIGALDSNKMP
jgi:hypothetical protein